MKIFKTLRGFIMGDEAEQSIYFNYSVTLRIFGEIGNLNSISEMLNLQPTLSYLKGEKKNSKSPSYNQDMWQYQPPLKETEPLENHIEALWLSVKEKKDYLLELKKTLNVDIFIGYRSNCDHAGIQIPHHCLEIFTELKIPFGISIVIE